MTESITPTLRAKRPFPVTIKTMLPVIREATILQLIAFNKLRALLSCILKIPPIGYSFNLIFFKVKVKVLALLVSLT